MDEIIKSNYYIILYNMLHIYFRCEMSAHIKLLEICNSNVLNNVYSTYDRSILSAIDPDINYLNSTGNLINSEYFITLKINTCFSLFHLILNIRSVPLHFSELLAFLDVLEI